jgi:hypothetical protein
MSGSTPAASTTKIFIFNNLQTTSAGKAKKNAAHKLFRIKQIQISTRHFEEPPPGKTINIFVVCENIRTYGFGGRKCVPKLKLEIWSSGRCKSRLRRPNSRQTEAVFATTVGKFLGPIPGNHIDDLGVPVNIAPKS